MKKEISNCLAWYANMMAKITQYESWSDEFCRKEARENTDKFLEEIKKYIDWNNLTKKEAKELQFVLLSSDEGIDAEIADLRKPKPNRIFMRAKTVEEEIAILENTRGVMMIPLYLFPIIPHGTELISIFGESIIYEGQKLDNDIRCGCVAYGIRIKRMTIKEFSKSISGRELSDCILTDDEINTAKECGFVVIAVDHSCVNKDKCKDAKIMFSYNVPNERIDYVPWIYETDIPHETFMIYEGGEPYCRGIVFSVEDVK